MMSGVATEAAERLMEAALAPRLSFRDAAVDLRATSISKLRRWALGYTRTHRGVEIFDQPLVDIDGHTDDVHPLSALNVLELAFLKAYRQQVSLQRIRQALRFVGNELGHPRPLLYDQFRTAGKDIYVRFLTAEAEPVHVNAGTHEPQITLDPWPENEDPWPPAVRRVVENVDYVGGVVNAWWPLGRGLPIVISPRVAGGKAVTAHSRVLVVEILGRFDHGETEDEIAEDTGSTRSEVSAALAMATND